MALGRASGKLLGMAAGKRQKKSMKKGAKAIKTMTKPPALVAASKMKDMLSRKKRGPKISEFQRDDMKAKPRKKR